MIDVPLVTWLTIQFYWRFLTKGMELIEVLWHGLIVISEHIHVKWLLVKHPPTEKDLAYLVTQGSVAGPVLHNCYASTVPEVLKPPLQLHGFADDHTVKDSFKSGTQEERLFISSLENCIREIKLWMDEKRLHMNSSKTEFLLVGSRQQLSKCTTDSIQVNGETVKCNKCIKYLGALADDRLNFKHFINAKYKMALWNLQKLIKKKTCFSDTRCIHCPSNATSGITYWLC